MMSYQTLLTVLENGLFTISINRPDKLNALNRAVMNDLDKVMDEVYTNADIRAVIITGAGPKAFVAGADISEFVGLSKKEGMKLSKEGQRIFFKIEQCPKPVVAAINGFALGGGCELAMACHFRLCNELAKFGQPEVNLGLIPGYGGTQRLTRLIGKGKSMEIQMTAQTIDAREAYRLGLVNYITTAEELLPKAKELLAIIQTKAPIAISKVISCVNTATGSDIDAETAINGYDSEVNAFGECFASADMKEGTSAFLEKRKANFKGE